MALNTVSRIGEDRKREKERERRKRDFNNDDDFKVYL